MPALSKPGGLQGWCRWSHRHHPARLLVVLSVLAGCGSGAVEGGAVDTPGSSEVTGGTPSATSPDPLTALRPNAASPDPSVVDAGPWPFTRTAAGSAPSSLVVEFTTDGSDCQALGAVDVAETASTVTVTLTVGRRPAADCGGARSQLAAPMVVTVPLRAPLGTREVRDGAR